jgi:hypothetical protein
VSIILFGGGFILGWWQGSKRGGGEDKDESELTV